MTSKCLKIEKARKYSHLPILIFGQDTNWSLYSSKISCDRELGTKTFSRIHKLHFIKLLAFAKNKIQVIDITKANMLLKVKVYQHRHSAPANIYYPNQ